MDGDDVAGEDVLRTEDQLGGGEVRLVIIVVVRAGGWGRRVLRGRANVVEADDVGAGGGQKAANFPAFSGRIR